MSGICGIVAIDIREPIDTQALKRMTAAMAHRGPDCEGTWISPDNVAGLGHRRLAIIDIPEEGQQPIRAADDSVGVQPLLAVRAFCGRRGLLLRWLMRLRVTAARGARAA